jgi:predicted AAA+ superfamily ATPase
MKQLERYIVPQVSLDLTKKMVFVGGPRQVGKTTMAKHLLGSAHQGYLNWDISKDREAILQQQFPDTDMWVFDEIHKYRSWRDYLKDIYDNFGETKKILVTGSARLDYYRYGCESLQGRYHFLRLNPLSIAELNINTQQELLELLQLGGFPEQFFTSSEIESKRWSREYRQRLIQEDLLSLETVIDVGKLELLMLRLPKLIGSPLSINAISQDLQVNHKTVAKWLDIFERLYAIFRLPPFGAPTIRAVKKEQKHFHYDWTLISENGSRFENFVGLHLLKWVQYEIDTKARELELRYFRDIDGREVDFIITENEEPILAIEVKWSDTDINKGLKYFKNKFPKCEAWQISAIGTKDYISKEKIRVSPAGKLLSKLA